MLEQLSIKNVAVIDRLEVSLKEGVSVLTGETGAGKSIIIDSINMILGSRANKELIRYGKDKAEVQAVFSMNEDVRCVLEENDIDTDDECVIISRKLTSDGKSTARINGTVVTLNMLRDIADLLINIHGQHDNQALLTPSKHILFLDSYAKDEKLLSEYKEIYKQKKETERRLCELSMDEQEKMQKIDLLSYQVNEIVSAKLATGEEEELISQRKLLENAESINSAAEKVYGNLYDFPGGMSAYDMISTAVEALGSISDLDDNLSQAYDALSSAMYTVEDVAREVRDFGNGVEFDEQALDEVEQRLDLINRLKRKYGATVEAVIQYGEKAQAELDEIVTSDEQTQKLKEELKRNEAQLKEIALRLSSERKKAALKLEKEIEKSLHELNMEKAVFSVSVKSRECCANGADTVEFVIATNPGEELKPLIRIASGGELSRVMLAIKSVLAQTDGVETLIFDEIDTGVSGDAAKKIADKLKAIGKTKQVICITHLPQLASAADNHFLISKNVEGELASTTLEELDFDGRVKELARIVGGGSAGKEYAREMLKGAGK